MRHGGDSKAYHIFQPSTVHVLESRNLTFIEAVPRSVDEAFDNSNGMHAHVFEASSAVMQAMGEVERPNAEREITEYTLLPTDVDAAHTDPTAYAAQLLGQEWVELIWRTLRRTWCYVRHINAVLISLDGVQIAKHESKV